MVRKTELDDDYPYLTSELSALLGKGLNFIARAAQGLKLKGDSKYHTEVRTSKSGNVHRYSEAAKELLRTKFETDPNYSPYRN